MVSGRGSLELATPDEAEGVAALRNAVSDHLTSVHGRGNWSGHVTARGALNGMRTGKVFVVRERDRLVATLCLTTRKPWAIDPSYFTTARRPLYLVSMAVAPDLQGQGIGRRCLEDAARIARAWPADAVWLDAYEGPAGAGEFYRRCGYTEVGGKVYRTVPLVYYELRL